MASQMEVILAVRNQGIENFDKAAEKVDKLNGKFKPFNDSLNKLNQRLSALAIAYKSITLLTSSFDIYFSKIPKGTVLTERDAEARNKQIQSVKNLKDAYDGLKFSAAQGLMSLIGGDVGLNKITAFIEGLTQTRNESYLTNRIAALQAGKRESFKSVMDPDSPAFQDPRAWAAVDARNKITDYEIKGLQKELDTMKRRGAFQGIDLKKETPKEKALKAKEYNLKDDPEYQLQKAIQQGEDARQQNKLDAIEREKQAKEKAHLLFLKWLDDEAKAEQAKRDLNFQTAQSALSNASQVVAMYAENNKGMFELNKALSIANATMNTWEGATKAIAQGGVFGPILATSIVALGMAQVAAIASTEYKAYARGTMFAGGGPSLVGENGPEFVNLPRGSQVYNNSQTRNMINNSKPVYNINISGGSDVVKQIERAIRSKELDTRIFR